EEEPARFGARELRQPPSCLPQQAGQLADEKIHRLLRQALPQPGDSLEYDPWQRPEGAGVKVRHRGVQKHGRASLLPVRCHYVYPSDSSGFHCQIIARLRNFPATSRVSKRPLHRMKKTATLLTAA